MVSILTTSFPLTSANLLEQSTVRLFAILIIVACFLLSLFVESSLLWSEGFRPIFLFFLSCSSCSSLSKPLHEFGVRRCPRSDPAMYPPPTPKGVRSALPLVAMATPPVEPPSRPPRRLGPWRFIKPEDLSYVCFASIDSRLFASLIIVICFLLVR